MRLDDACESCLGGISVRGLSPACKAGQTLHIQIYVSAETTWEDN